MSAFMFSARLFAAIAVLFTALVLSTPASARTDAPLMVRIPGKYYEIGKYEVTQGEWRAVMGNNPSYFSNCGDNCPVERVSWNDVQDFIKKLNAQTGKQFRLPSKAEWDYACYGGHQTKYCGGDDLDSLGWFDKNSDGRTHPVGQKQPNGYGLYDMNGNVFEWMSDCYEKNCVKHMLGGGAWSNNEQLALPTYHGGVDATFRIGNNFGFRLARTLP